MLRLNLGCGPNVFPGWVNVDVEDVWYTYIRHLEDAESFEGWPEEQRKLGEYVKAGGLIELHQADITKIDLEMSGTGQLFRRECADAIYLGQVVEHLNPIYELPQLLKRCYELLKPGGRIRITTPDLDALLWAFEDSCEGKEGLAKFAHEQPAFYAKAPPGMQLSLLMFGASGPNCTRSNYEGHFACYRLEELGDIVAEAGFNRVEQANEPSKIFHDVIDCGMSHSFAMESEK